MKPQILIVEDDAEINALVSRYLSDNDLDVVSASDSSEVDALLKSNNFDLMILDINLPTEDGLSLCVRLRRSSHMPIIMLTAKSEELDRVLGLELGADDYVCKPFNPRELLARIRAVLRRRAATEGTTPTALKFAGWRMDLVRRRLANPQGADVVLTSAEYGLLAIFCENAGQVLSRDQLMEIAKGYALSGRSVDVLVSRLRRKIEADTREPALIKTVRSGGYVFAARVGQEP